MQHEWEIWLDVHVSPIIAKWMSEYTDYNIKSAYKLSFQNLSDLEIYQKAKDQGNVIILSKDADFPNIISRLGAPPKLINIQFGNCNNRSFWEHIKDHIKYSVELLISSETDIIEID